MIEIPTIAPTTFIIPNPIAAVATTATCVGCVKPAKLPKCPACAARPAVLLGSWPSLIAAGPVIAAVTAG